MSSESFLGGRSILAQHDLKLKLSFTLNLRSQNPKTTCRLDLARTDRHFHCRSHSVIVSASFAGFTSKPSHLDRDFSISWQGLAWLVADAFTLGKGWH